MTLKAALDNFALMVSARLMGREAARRLCIDLASRPDAVIPFGMDLAREKRLFAMVDGLIEPENHRDRYDLYYFERQRNRPLFDPTFWRIRAWELVQAGLDPDKAAQLVADVRCRVDPEGSADPDGEHAMRPSLVLGMDLSRLEAEYVA